ncbi:tyrosinase family protein [Reichenbachiella sp.]|uniref:tyrosinase family protein n=1 Tax=Reichenbachiella sp. TaxID=2184521 RepID=UPI003BB0D9CE
MKRRDFIKSTALTAGATTLAISTPFAVHSKENQGVLQRKSIDEIDPSDYIDALTKLKDKNGGNDYVFYANIHNSAVKRCEHNNDLFFPWHRALLHYFEKALQAEVPGVTIPYYDYTKLPKSGKRYPAAFEKGGDILSQMYDDFQQKWVNTNRNTTSISKPFYPYVDEVTNVISKNPKWSSSNILTGGSSNGFGGLQRPLGGFGAIETPQHNLMHDLYIGGAMSSSVTAAFDPIFWSFHAYQDLIFELWLKKYGANTISDQGRSLKNMPESITLGEVLDTTRLGYIYDHPDMQPPVIASAIDEKNINLRQQTSGSYAQKYPHVAELAGSYEAETISIYSFDIPTTFKATPFVMKDVVISDTVNLTGFVFLHPEEVDYEKGDELFRERYLVDHFAIFSMPQMKGMKTDISIDLTQEIVRLSAQSPGKKYKVTVTGFDSAVTKDAKTSAITKRTESEILTSAELVILT